MAARLVKVFHVRLDLRDVPETGPHPLAALNRAVGAASVLRGAKARAPAPAAAKAPTQNQSPVTVQRDDRTAAKERVPAPVPPKAQTPKESPAAVLRDDRMVAKERAPAPVPPKTETPKESPGAVLRDDRKAVEDRLRVDDVQPIILEDPPSIWSRLQSGPDEPLSVRDIALTMAAVIVVGFGLTALLPSILTREVIETAATAVAPPAAQPPQIEQAGALQPLPDAVPAPLPVPAPAAPIPPAPVSNASASAAKTTPALRASNAPSDKQAGGRVAATAPTDLKAAEKTAAVVPPPRRPAQTRPALTDEEKAAVERGLRELEKDAQKAQP